MSHLYLIGMMGSGKTVTARRLAALLGYEFSDLDDMIEKKSGSTIAQIFSEKGEPFFREEEATILKAVSLPSAPSKVVATGGGIVLRPENVERMHSTGKVVFLKTSLETLWQRVKQNKERPLLAGNDPKQVLAKIFAERAALYEKASDFSVDTDGQKAESVARKIFETLKVQA